MTFTQNTAALYIKQGIPSVTQVKGTLRSWWRWHLICILFLLQAIHFEKASFAAINCFVYCFFGCYPAFSTEIEYLSYFLVLQKSHTSSLLPCLKPLNELCLQQTELQINNKGCCLIGRQRPDQVTESWLCWPSSNFFMWVMRDPWSLI